MDHQIPDSITSYYNDNRKRSFFFSRFFVIVSMIVLVGTLGINVSLLYSQQRTNTQSHADSGKPDVSLPPLPQGCEYQTKEKGVIVVCPTHTPRAIPTTASSSAFPVTVRLPKLPAQCEYVADANGTRVSCSSSAQAIPTVAVRAYTSCQASKQKDALDCKNAAGQIETTQLPLLPSGCSYKLLNENYFVDCN